MYMLCSVWSCVLDCVFGIYISISIFMYSMTSRDPKPFVFMSCAFARKYCCYIVIWIARDGWRTQRWLMTERQRRQTMMIITMTTTTTAGGNNDERGETKKKDSNSKVRFNSPRVLSTAVNDSVGHSRYL